MASLLDETTPSPAPKAKATPKRQAPASPSEAIMQAFSSMDPGLRPLAAAMIREEMPFLRGIPMTEDEIEMDRFQRSQAALESANVSFNQTLHNMLGIAIDGADQPIDGGLSINDRLAALGMEAVSAAYLENPEGLVNLSGVMNKALGGAVPSVTMGQMVMHGWKPALKSPMDRTDEEREKDAKRRKSFAHWAGKEGKVEEALIVSGADGVVADAEQLIKRAYKDVDVNLENMSVFENVMALNELYTIAVTSGAMAGIPSKAVTQAFNRKYKGVLGDAVEDIPKDERGNVLFGVGDSGWFQDDVNEPTSGALGSLALRIAQASGSTPTAVIGRDWEVPKVRGADLTLMPTAKEMILKLMGDGQ